MTNTVTGTAHFATLARAAVYYEPYGETLESVAAKVEAGEIFIGKPEDKPGVYHTLDAKEGRYMAHSVMTRAAYMAPKSAAFGTPEYKVESAAKHHAYFIQFATDATRALVKRAIGEQRIKDSRDPHFNDIPLREWDMINDSVRESCNRRAKIAANEFPNSDNTKFYWSVSDGTGIAKAVAREIRGAQTKGKLKEKTGVTFGNYGITLPEGTHVKLIKGASGTEGDLWAVESFELLKELTGDEHYSDTRYCFVPTESVYLD